MSNPTATRWIVPTFFCVALGACAARPPATPPNREPATRPARLVAPRAGEWARMVPEGADSFPGWSVVDISDFSAHGPVHIADGVITLETGNPMTGLAWTRDFPRSNYEIALDAMRVEGRDFFCGLTFPVGDFPCTLICGGWGGMVVGLSNVDHMHAADNETTQGIHFENARWYAIRLRVTADRIQVWIDEDRIINLETEGRTFSIWPEQEPVQPLGIATWYTKAALRNIRFRRL